MASMAQRSRMARDYDREYARQRREREAEGLWGKRKPPSVQRSLEARERATRLAQSEDPRERKLGRDLLAKQAAQATFNAAAKALSEAYSPPTRVKRPAPEQDHAKALSHNSTAVYLLELAAQRRAEREAQEAARMSEAMESRERMNEACRGRRNMPAPIRTSR